MCALNFKTLLIFCLFAVPAMQAMEQSSGGIRRVNAQENNISQLYDPIQLIRNHFETFKKELHFARAGKMNQNREAINRTIILANNALYDFEQSYIAKNFKVAASHFLQFRSSLLKIISLFNPPMRRTLLSVIVPIDEIYQELFSEDISQANRITSHNISSTTTWFILAGAASAIGACLLYKWIKK